MNDNKTIVKKESKNKIRVEFERTSAWTRFKLKYLSVNFFTSVVVKFFTFIMMVGVSYVILYPFFAKIAASVMTPDDLVNVTVKLISKSPTLDQFKYIILENRYLEALLNTTLLSLFCAVVQMLICSIVAYGISKFKFKLNNLVFFFVVFTMLVPHEVIQFAMFRQFSEFDILWIRELLSGKIIPALNVLDWNGNLLNTDWPLAILSLTGLGFRNGLYIFILRQFYKGVPDELEESAYIDGSGVFRTFFTIIIPLSGPMLITVFLFAFSWQFTDNFYTELFYRGDKAKILMPDIVKVPKSLNLATNNPARDIYNSAIYNTSALLIIIPLLVVYLFGQRYLVQGIARSGLTAE